MGFRPIQSPHHVAFHLAHVPDATPVAVRQQKESDQVPTPGGEREMPADICQQKTFQCDKGPWSTGEGQLTSLDLPVAVGTESSERYSAPDTRLSITCFQIKVTTGVLWPFLQLQQKA